jgi:hypothetical protein
MLFEDSKIKSNNRTIERDKLNREEKWTSRYKNRKEKKRENTKYI